MYLLMHAHFIIISVYVNVQPTPCCYEMSTHSECISTTCYYTYSILTKYFFFVFSDHG